MREDTLQGPRQNDTTEPGDHLEERPGFSRTPGLWSALTIGWQRPIRRGSCRRSAAQLAPQLVQFLLQLIDLPFDVSGPGRIRRPHVDDDRPTPRTIQGRLEVLPLLLAQDLLHLLQQLRARLVHQLADVLLVCRDRCHGPVLLLSRQFQIVNDPLDVSRTRTTRTRTEKTRSTRTRTFDPETESAAGTEPARSGRQLPDLLPVEGAILVRVASGDQVVHPFGQL